MAWVNSWSATPGNKLALISVANVALPSVVPAGVASPQSLS